MKNNFLSSKKFQRQFGLSMIELLVVMFIISLISAVTLANYRGGQRKYILTQSTQRLSSDIRKAQNMALSGYDLAESYRGYGVYIDKDVSYYIIYGDKNNNTTYQPSDDIIETIYLPDNIEIKSTSSVEGKIHIFFEPPQPVTYIDGDKTAGILRTVTLGLKNSSESKLVRITTAGLIQVE